MGSERGSMSMLMVMIVAITTLMAMMVGATAAAAVRRGRIDAVADLVALAAATGGRPAASRVAAANAVALERCAWRGARVGVEVRLGDLSATAAAELATPS